MQTRNYYLNLLFFFAPSRPFRTYLIHIWLISFYYFVTLVLLSTHTHCTLLLYSLFLPFPSIELVVLDTTNFELPSMLVSSIIIIIANIFCLITDIPPPRSDFALWGSKRKGAKPKDTDGHPANRCPIHGSPGTRSEPTAFQSWTPPRIHFPAWR